MTIAFSDAVFFRGMLLSLALTPALSTTASYAQENTQGGVHFTNNTGEPRNDFFIRYNQTIESVDPNPVPPFTQTTVLNEEVFRLEGASIPDGGRVPATDEMTWTGSGDPGQAMHIVCAAWSLDGQVKNFVARVICPNRTGAAADEVTIRLDNAQVGGLDILHTDQGDILDGGSFVRISGIDVQNNSDFGPVQVTLKEGQGCPREVQCSWSKEGDRTGSLKGQLVKNDIGVPADGLTVRTNVPVTDLEPLDTSPFTQVSGLGSSQLSFRGGLVKPGKGMLDELLIVTNNNPDAPDIEVLEVQWSPSLLSIPALDFYGVLAFVGIVVFLALAMLLRSGSP